MAPRLSMGMGDAMGRFRFAALALALAAFSLSPTPARAGPSDAIAAGTSAAMAWGTPEQFAAIDKAAAMLRKHRNFDLPLIRRGVKAGRPEAEEAVMRAIVARADAPARAWESAVPDQRMPALPAPTVPSMFALPSPVQPPAAPPALPAPAPAPKIDYGAMFGK